MFDCETSRKSLTNRPNYMTRGRIGASVAAAGAMLNRVYGTAYGKRLRYHNGRLSKGDIAILRFLAAFELIECDLWQQYEELGGVKEGPQNSYQLALQFHNDDASQYITSNTLDEIGHVAYLNAYLESEGADPVDFDLFRNLRGSRTTGAQNIGRLTNLMHLDMDTAWYIRHRDTKNLNCGASTYSMIRIVNRQSIPRTDADCDDPQQVQVIANTAALQFGYIEHAGASLYAHFSQELTRVAVLRVVLGIGSDELAHFLVWEDFVGHAIQGPPFDCRNAELATAGHDGGLPCFNREPSHPLWQTWTNIPVPDNFIGKTLPYCPVTRPFDDQFRGGIATINSLTRNGLFIGQSPEFMDALMQMAKDADSAAAVEGHLLSWPHAQ